MMASTLRCSPSRVVTPSAVMRSIGVSMTSTFGRVSESIYSFDTNSRLQPIG